jgi:hypothetical protein
MALSAQTVQELRQQLNAAMLQPPPAAAAVTPQDFCTFYKQTLRPILVIAAKLVPAPYGIAITGLMTILDEVCP